MARALDWESRIGRRLRLRDLHILFGVVQHGSMAAAGAHMGMSQSAVSQAIAALEHALGVRLLDRTPRGVEPTMYAEALMRRGRAAFDELRSGVKDIEHLADPAAGEVRIGCSEAISAGILPLIIERFYRRYPRVVFEVGPSDASRLVFPELHDRRADLVLATLPGFSEERLGDDVQAEVLFNDRICLAVGRQSPWARRRKIHFDDLVDAYWIIPYVGAPSERAVTEAFRARGLPPPRIAIKTLSVQLRNFLGMRHPFVSLMPASILRFHADTMGLKILPIELSAPSPPVVMITLKNRTLSRTVELFLDCAREVAKSMPVHHGTKKIKLRT
jgi:DNA-binding transcriptional LysR family regulator